MGEVFVSLRNAEDMTKMDFSFHKISLNSGQINQTRFIYLSKGISLRQLSHEK